MGSVKPPELCEAVAELAQASLDTASAAWGSQRTPTFRRSLVTNSCSSKASQQGPGTAAAADTRPLPHPGPEPAWEAMACAGREPCRPAFTAEGDEAVTPTSPLTWVPLFPHCCVWGCPRFCSLLLLLQTLPGGLAPQPAG